MGTFKTEERLDIYYHQLEVINISKIIDLTNQKFGKLTVVEKTTNPNSKKKRTYWLCQCECGNIVTLNKNYVQSGHTKSCGCLQKEAVSLSNTKNWTGVVSDYGVEFISQSRKNKCGQWLWNCKCPLCNKTFEILPANIMDGSTTSCGCKIQSKGERYIQYILEENNIKYIPQYSFDDCKYKYKLKFDFALLNNNGEVFYLIEYDGRQHFEPIDFYGGEKHFEETKIRDSIKNQYCLDNNIKLLRLKYDLRNEEIKEKIVNIIYP